MVGRILKGVDHELANRTADLRMPNAACPVVRLGFVQDGAGLTFTYRRQYDQAFFKTQKRQGKLSGAYAYHLPYHRRSMGKTGTEWSYHTRIFR